MEHDENPLRPQARPGRVRGRPAPHGARRRGGGEGLPPGHRPPVLAGASARASPSGRSAERRNIIAGAGVAPEAGVRDPPHRPRRRRDLSRAGTDRGLPGARPVRSPGRAQVRGSAGGGDDPHLRRPRRGGRSPRGAPRRLGRQQEDRRRRRPPRALDHLARARLQRRDRPAALPGHRPVRHRRSAPGRDEPRRRSCTERGRAAPPLAEVEERLAGTPRDALRARREDRPPDLRTVSVVPVGADGRVLLLRRTEARGGFWQPVTGRHRAGRAHPRRPRGESSSRRPAPTWRWSPLGYRHGFGIEPGARRAVPPGSGSRRGDRLRGPPAARVRVPALGRARRARLALARRGARGLRFAGLRRAVRLATGRASRA